MKSISAVVIVVIVLLAGAYLYRPVYVTPAEVEAQQEQTVSIRAYTLTYSDASDGAECLFAGGLTAEDTNNPFDQVIVSDASGTIVGAIDLQVGEFITGDNDQQTCSVVASLSLNGSPFYTFEVDGKFKRTISWDAMNAMEWQVPVHVIQAT